MIISSRFEQEQISSSRLAAPRIKISFLMIDDIIVSAKKTIIKDIDK